MSKGKMDSKAVMAWVKSRWSLVFFAVVALLLVPAMVYFAMGLAESKHAAFQKQVDADAADFKAPSVTYSVPSLTSAEKIAEANHTPNEAMTAAYKGARDAQQAAAAGVVTEAVKHNKGEGDREHKMLLDKFFPTEGVNNVALAKQFRRVYVGDAVKSLLELINAKEPIAAEQLTTTLREHERNFLARELGSDVNDGGRAKLSEDKNKALDRELVDLRFGQYNLWSQKASVYAGPDIFTLPAVVEANTPTPIELWDWQVQYWTMQDILRAVASVNAPGKDQGVRGSVVKRIEKLTVDADAALAGGTGAPTDPNAPPPAPAGAAPSTDQAPDYTKSVTGHKSGGLFDVRTATLTCVVRTKDIPKLFDALAESNMLTVTSVQFTKVDLSAELKAGYFYGDGEHVTRATITMEALWLREWTKDYMPKEVKVALGLEAADPNAAPAPGTTPGTTPAPQPVGRRAGGAAGG